MTGRPAMTSVAATARRVYLSLGFMQGIIFGMWGLTAVVWWVVELDLRPLRLVLLGSFLVGTMLLAEIPTGVVADAYSRKWSIVVSWVVMAAALALAPITAFFPIMLVWQVLYAVGWTFQSGADTAWVTDETGVEDDALIMRHAIFRSLGLLVGIALGALGGQWSLRGTMVLAGCAAGLYAVGLARVMQEHAFTPVEQTEGRRQQMVDIWSDGWTTVRASVALIAMFLSVVLSSMAAEAINTLDTPRLVELGLEDYSGAQAVAWFGAVWFVMTLVNIPIMVLAERRLDDVEERVAAGWLVVLWLAAGIGIFLLAGPWLWIGVIGWLVRDVAAEVTEPLTIAWANRRAESAVRATVISFRGQAQALGELVGGLALGVVAELISIAAALTVAGVLLCLAAIPFVLLRRQTPLGSGRSGQLAFEGTEELPGPLR